MKKEHLKTFLNIITFNFKTLIKYEFLYKLALMFVMIPIAIWCFNFTMHISGYRYITLENVNAFLSSPITIFMLLLILLFLLIVTLFDYVANIVIFDFSYHKKEINLIEVFKISFDKIMNIIFLPKIYAPEANTSNTSFSISLPIFAYCLFESKIGIMTISFITAF